MIKRTVHFALHQPLFVIMMLVLFIGGGLLAFKSLPIEAFPDVGDLQVNVITLYPGRAAEEVEKQVTIPVERRRVMTAAGAVTVMFELVPVMPPGLVAMAV